MPIYTFYKTTNGDIVSELTCPASDVEANIRPGTSYVEGAYSAFTYYIPNGVPTSKAPMSPVVIGSTISNLPIPCTVHVDATLYQVDDGVFEFSSPLPGPYKCIISAVPYLTTEVTLP